MLGNAIKQDNIQNRLFGVTNVARGERIELIQGEISDGKGICARSASKRFGMGINAARCPAAGSS
jgi:hypothetical protein